MKTYHPVRFYLIVFGLTWDFWLWSAVHPQGNNTMTLMLLGLCVPAVTALSMILFSGNQALKADLKRKLVGFHCLRPRNMIAAIALFGLIVIASILISVLGGQSLAQLAFTEGFSFSIQGTSALATILLAAIIEEMGWRGYGEDAIAQYTSWFRESILFGGIWSLWHLPLFLIEGTYQAGLLQLGWGYALNFLLSVIPLGFLTTWVYVENNRSMLASIIFHLFVNLFQEKIAMTPQTKCLETLVITVAAVGIVLTHRQLFFATDHVGRLLESGDQSSKRRA